MTRDEATALVEPHVIRVKQYRAVPLSDVKELLDDDTYARLLRDPIKGLGPTRDTIYPWNVIDYLLLQEQAA